MHQEGYRLVGHRRTITLSAFGIGLLFLGALWPALAWAAASTYCPTLNATVANGGSVAIDASSCDGPLDGGMSGPIAPFALHGTVTIGTNSGGIQFVAYTHNGDSATSDTFALEDNLLGVVTVNVTISPAISPIVVSPAVLPTLTVGSPFAQSLASSGGTAPYTYVLGAGTLPAGLVLTSSGLLSGTPTRRGGYSFSVRAQDALGGFVLKAYAGTVQNPALSISPTASTATQGVAFSQALTPAGGVAPVAFALEAGSFPAGVSVSSGGVVSGTTAAAAGAYPVTLRVTDSSTGTGSYFELKAFSLTVSLPPFRAYLSRNGVDTNPCTLALPCRLLPAALAAVRDGGEVWMLDSANFNTGLVDIAKSVTILAVPGAAGSVVANGAHAMRITGASNLEVTLRNLVILNLSGAGNTGIQFSQGSQLTVEGCEIYGLGTGISGAAAGGLLAIRDSTIRDNASAGVALQGTVFATLEGTALVNNSAGGAVLQAGAQAQVSGSTITGSAIGASAAASAGATTRLTLSATEISGNGTGVSVSAAAGGDTAQVVLQNATITHNTTGVALSGAGTKTVFTRQNNALKFNGTDISGGALTPLTAQ